LANVGLGPELIKKKKKSLIYTTMESDKWSFMLGLREKNRLNKEKK
jgi:hypothetical protein